MVIDFKKSLMVLAILFTNNLFAMESVEVSKVENLTEASVEQPVAPVVLEIPGLSKEQSKKINKLFQKVLMAEKTTGTKRAGYAAVRILADIVCFLSIHDLCNDLTDAEKVIPFLTGVALLANYFVRSNDNVLESMQELDNALEQAIGPMSDAQKEAISEYVKNNAIKPIVEKIENEKNGIITKMGVIADNGIELMLPLFCIGFLRYDSILYRGTFLGTQPADSGQVKRFVRIVPRPSPKNNNMLIYACFASFFYSLYHACHHPELEKAEIIEHMEKMLD